MGGIGEGGGPGQMRMQQRSSAVVQGLKSHWERVPWMDRGDRRQVTVGAGEEKLDELGYKSSRVGDGDGGGVIVYFFFLYQFFSL